MYGSLHRMGTVKLLKILVRREMSRSCPLDAFVEADKRCS